MSNIINNEGTFAQYKDQINTDVDINSRILSISDTTIPILTASQYITASIDSVNFGSSYLDKIIDTNFSEFIYYPQILTTNGLLLISKSEYLQLETENLYLSSSIIYSQSINDSEIKSREYRNIALKNTACTINLSVINIINNLMTTKYYNNTEVLDLLNNLKTMLYTSYDNLLFNEYTLVNSSNEFINKINVPIIMSKSFMDTTYSWVEDTYINKIYKTDYVFNVTEDLLKYNIFTPQTSNWDAPFKSTQSSVDIKLNLSVYPLSVTDVDTVNEYDAWLKNLKVTLRNESDIYLYTYFDTADRTSFLKQCSIPNSQYFIVELNADPSSYELDIDNSYLRFIKQASNSVITGSTLSDTVPIYEYSTVGMSNIYINKDQLGFYGYKVEGMGHEGVLPVELKLNIRWAHNPSPITSKYLQLEPLYPQLSIQNTSPWNTTDIENFEKFRKGLILTLTNINNNKIIHEFYPDANGNFDSLQLNKINLQYGRYRLDFNGSAYRKYNNTFRINSIRFFYKDDNGQEISLYDKDMEITESGGRIFNIKSTGRGYLFKFDIIWISIIDEIEFGESPINYDYHKNVIYDAAFDTNRPESYWGGLAEIHKPMWWINKPVFNMLEGHNLNGVRETFSTSPNGLPALFENYGVYNKVDRHVDWSRTHTSYLIIITSNIPYSDMTEIQKNQYDEWINTAIIKFEFEDATTNMLYSISSYFNKEQKVHAYNQSGRILLDELYDYTLPSVIPVDEQDWWKLPHPVLNFPNTTAIKRKFKIKFNKSLEDYNLYDIDIINRNTKKAHYIATVYSKGAATPMYVDQVIEKTDINNTEFIMPWNKFYDYDDYGNKQPNDNGLFNPVNYYFNMKIEYIVK